MAGKNTAAFGIYPNRASVDRAVDTLKDENFRNTDISVLFPKTRGRRILPTRRTPKRLKVPLRELAQEPWSVEG